MESYYNSVLLYNLAIIERFEPKVVVFFQNLTLLLKGG